MAKLEDLFALQNSISAKTEKSCAIEEPFCLLLSEMEDYIVYPKDVLQPLFNALDDRFGERKKIDLADIKIFSLYDKSDGSFFGTLYAIKHENGFCGNVLGDREICYYSNNKYEFKETNEVWAPIFLEKNRFFEEDGVCGNNKVWCVLCEYKHEDTSLMAKYIVTIDTTTQNKTVVHEFKPWVSYEAACDYFKKIR